MLIKKKIKLEHRNKKKRKTDWNTLIKIRLEHMNKKKIRLEHKN